MSIRQRLNTVTDALANAGISAMRGFPAAKIQVPEVPVAAVTVERSDEKETVLAVRIYCNATQGGEVCEDAAQTAADALRQEGGICQVEGCQYDGRNNLLSVRILALWTEEIACAVQEGLACTVQVDGETLDYATAFSAVQNRQIDHVTDDGTGETVVLDTEVSWTITVQEQLPFDMIPEVEEQEAFTLKVIHDNYVETFPDCYWLSITLEENVEGLLRKRIARSWSERSVL